MAWLCSHARAVLRGSSRLSTRRSRRLRSASPTPMTTEGGRIKRVAEKFFASRQSRGTGSRWQGSAGPRQGGRPAASSGTRHLRREPPAPSRTTRPPLAPLPPNRPLAICPSFGTALMVEAVRAGRRRGRHRLRVWRTARSQVSLRNPTIASYQTLGSRRRPLPTLSRKRERVGRGLVPEVMWDLRPRVFDAPLVSTAGAAQESLWL